MPDDALMTASLAYRKNEAAIVAGDVPDKYTRILPHIPGKHILEVGSAEGVLALLMAKEGKTVTALEMRSERHEAALALSDTWGRLFRFKTAPAFVCGRIGEHLDLLEGKDTLVAVRMVYYLRDDIDWIFARVARHVPNVVLCGNGNRAARWREDRVPFDDRLGRFNYYASAEGMTDLLERHGYEATTAVADGDQIVVGRMA